MTARTTPPFRAGHVGSFLRPKYPLDAREKRARGEITPAELRGLTRRAPKVTIPSPTMLHFRGGRAGIGQETYPDLEPFYQEVAREVWGNP
jgi:methionine synthase II (cobalamin-independent)